MRIQSLILGFKGLTKLLLRVFPCFSPPLAGSRRKAMVGTMEAKRIWDTEEKPLQLIVT